MRRCGACPLARAGAAAGSPFAVPGEQAGAAGAVDGPDRSTFGAGALRTSRRAGRSEWPCLAPSCAVLSPVPADRRRRIFVGAVGSARPVGLGSRLTSWVDPMDQVHTAPVRLAIRFPAGTLGNSHPPVNAALRSQDQCSPPPGPRRQAMASAASTRPRNREHRPSIARSMSSFPGISPATSPPRERIHPQP